MQMLYQFTIGTNVLQDGVFEYPQEENMSATGEDFQPWTV